MAHDTTKIVEEIYIAKLKEKTDIQRALMGFSMFETARYLIKMTLHESGIVKPEEIKIAIFNRFYSWDFDQKTRDKIIAHLSNCQKEHA